MNALRARLRIYLLLLVLVMVTGSLGFMYFEGLSFLDSIYMNIVTMSTVGYGDIQPTTVAGKFIVIFIIIGGVVSFVGAISNATELMIYKGENKRHNEKINMVIGAFFSEVGTELLGYFCQFDKNIDKIRNDLIINDNWDEVMFSEIHKTIMNHYFEFEINGEELLGIRRFLMSRREFMVRLLENPILLEQEKFTRLLREVFHVTEELTARTKLEESPISDIKHISNDMRKACVLLVHQWLDYMFYIKNNYPNLFSFASRVNPFVVNSSPVIIE